MLIPDARTDREMPRAAPGSRPGPARPVLVALVRNGAIALTALLTTIDLFAVQAILPSLADAYRVSPAAMGTAVNASTFGMAIGGLAVAFFGRKIDRRRGVALSLAILAIPTAVLAVAPDLATFAGLRVIQGLCMAAAFALMLAYVGENCSAEDAASAFAAYITGNVASNLFGRLVSASVADHVGPAPSFYAFAILNLCGAVFAYLILRNRTALAPETALNAAPRAPLSAWAEHFRNPSLRAGFGVGFCTLFAFIGTFTYVNFALVREPFALGMMALGLVYFVFLPSIVTTPLAGRAVARFGARSTVWGALAVAGAGLPLMLTSSLGAMLAGLVLVGVGTFLAQASATGFVSRAAATDRGSASGLYLACYYLGGLAGAFLCGQAFAQFGWPGCMAAVAMSLAAAALLARRLEVRACAKQESSPTLSLQPSKLRY